MEWETNPNYRIIIDNGSYQIKAGLSSKDTPSIIMQNLTASNRKTGDTIFGDSLNDIFLEKDYIYTKPLIRGALVNFDNETLIWDEILKQLLRSYDNNMPTIKNKELLLNLTIPPMLPNKIKEKIIEIIFEYYGFGGFYPVNTNDMLKEYINETYKGMVDNIFNLIIESGNSCTYAIPYFDNECMNYGIKKVDIGGRLLTNYLKEIITFRYLDVSNDFQTVYDIKEKLCFISKDFQYDIRQPKNTFLRHYVLPDPEIKSKGYATDTIDPNTMFRDEVVSLDKERFTVPELLFNPANIGINQGGIVETIFQSLNAISPDLYENMLENIFVYGGNTHFPGFMERLAKEIRSNSPDYMEPRITWIKNFDAIYKGCYYNLMKQPLRDLSVKKADYDERGGLNLINLYLV